MVQTKPQHAELIEFYTRLFQLTPRVYITPCLVAANLVVFAVMAISGVSIFRPLIIDLINWGANHGPQTLNGQWYRLFTSMFIHIGVIHIAFNMWVLWDLGKLVERLTGNLPFLVLYVLSGLAGSMASVLWNPHVVSAGASGAVFGIMGVLLGFLLLRRDSVPAQVLSQVRASGGTFLAYNLIFGLAVPGIDMAAHIGGLAAGFVGGMIVSQPLDQITAGSRLFRSALVSVLGGGGLAVAAVLAPAPADVEAALTNFGEVEEKVLERYQKLAESHQAGNLSDEEFARALEEEIIPPWKAERESLASLEVPKQGQAYLGKLVRYMQLREESWLAFSRFLRTGDEAALTESNQKMEEVQKMLEEIKQDQEE